MRPSSGLGYNGRMFKKLVNYNFVGSAGKKILYTNSIYSLTEFYDTSNTNFYVYISLTPTVLYNIK
jgi:hypothetical protein